MKTTTYVLWFGPALILLLGVLGVVLYFARLRRAPAEAAPLSAEEHARLERLLADEARGEARGGARAGPDSP